jgi:hypothetical protein
MSPLTSRKAAEMIGVAIRSLEALYGEVAVGDDPGTGSGVMQ